MVSISSPPIYGEDLNLIPSEHHYKIISPYNFLIMEPNSVVESYEGGLKYHANNFGFRDDDFEIESHKPLALVTGESRAYGIGVDYRQRWTNLLSEKLKEKDVYNLSMPAASLEHQYLILEHFLAQLKRPAHHIWVQAPPQREELPLLRSRVWGSPKPRLIRHGDGWRFQAAPITFGKTWPERLGVSVYSKEFWERSLAKGLQWVEQQTLHVYLAFLRSYYRIEMHIIWSELLQKFEELALIYGSELYFISRDWDTKKMLRDLQLNHIDIKDLSSSKYHVNPTVMHINLEGNTRVAQRVACQVLNRCELFKKELGGEL